MRTLQFDTEFNRAMERDLNPVCGVVRIGGVESRYWFVDEAERARFREDWSKWMAEGIGIVCYLASAEARVLLALGFSPADLLSWNWLDIFIYWRMLTFSHTEFRWGRKVIDRAGQRVWIHTEKPPLGEPEEDEWGEGEDGQQHILRHAKERYKTVGASLADAVAHRLGIDMDTARKIRMRDLILTSATFTDYQRKIILDYCAEDVVHLLPLLNNLLEAVEDRTHGHVGLEQLVTLSRYMVCNGIVESNGLPILVEKARGLGSNYVALNDALIRDCNADFPFFVERKLTKKEKGEGAVGEFKWVESQEAFESYIISSGLGENWPRSEKNNKMLKNKDLLSEYEADPILGKLALTKKSRNQIKYFRPSGWEKIRRNIGSDGRVRALLGAFGSKTGRNQPSPSKGFVFGWSTWLRPLIGAEGKVILGGDYSAEEMTLQGWASGDERLLEACSSGDPYVWLAQFSGAMDSSIRKTEHGYVDESGQLLSKDGQVECKGTRNLFKSLMLGMGYGMGLDKLSTSLTQSRIAALPHEDRMTLALSRIHNEDLDLQMAADEILESVRVHTGKGPSESNEAHKKASTYRDYHRDTFSTYWKWRAAVIETYNADGFLSVEDGWTLFAGEKDQTVANFPIQGLGGCILRRAIERCILAGLEVIAPLHDAVYVLSDPEDVESDLATLVREMENAVVDVCGASLIRVEAKPYRTDWVNFASTFTEDKQSREFKTFGHYMVS